MANRRKRTKRWQWANSILWWAFLISGLIHLGLVYLLPSVEIFPADSGYIEVDELWLVPVPEEGASGDSVVESLDDGLESGQPQDSTDLWDIPPQLEAIEPATATGRTPDVVWDTAFLGVETPAPEILATPELERGVSTPSEIPPMDLNQRRPRMFTKQTPDSDVELLPDKEPEVQPEIESELQAEQRFENYLASQMRSQRPLESIEPESLPATVPEVLEPIADMPLRLPQTNRQAFVQPVSKGSATPRSSETPPEKSRPSFVLPDIPDQESPLDEEKITLTETELQAEQRFEEYLASQMRSQRLPEPPEPERLLAAVPKVLDTVSDMRPTLSEPDRQLPTSPASPDSSVALAPEVPLEKSLPTLSAPETFDQEASPDDEQIPVTMPESATMAAAQPELQPDADSLVQFSESIPLVLPKSSVHQQESQTLASLQHATPKMQRLPRPIEPVHSIAEHGHTVPQILNYQRKNPITTNQPGESTKPMLRLHENTARARVPMRLQPKSGIPRERPSDSPRAITTPAFQNPKTSPTIAMTQQSMFSEKKRSFLLGARESVASLPLDGSRFGVVSRKEPTLPEEDVAADTELHPEEQFDQIEQPRDQERVTELTIEGPAATRQVLFKPRRFPEVELDVEVTIRLKFWVLPDGTIGEVIPLQRGDVRLERAAVEYLKNWRFTPVPPNSPQMWGIIPITYTLD